MFSISILTHKFFKNPLQQDKPFIAFPYQRKLMNMVDFGYDPENEPLDPKDIGLKYPEIICMISARQRGKTASVAATVAALCVMWENAKIGIMSNTDENAKKFIDRIYFYLSNSQFHNVVKTKTTAKIITKKGVEVYSFGMTEGVRGNPLRLLIVDEAALFPDSILEDAAIPAVSMAGAHVLMGTPSVILISTPRGNMGKFLEYYFKGFERREIVCVDCHARYTHEDFPHLEKWSDINDPHTIPLIKECRNCGGHNFQWVHTGRVGIIKVGPYEHPFMSREEIDALVEEHGNTPEARQEYLGEIAIGANKVFTRQMLNNCTLPELHNIIRPQKKEKYYLSADFGKLHDATVFMVAHRDQDDTIILDYMERMEAKGGMEYSDINYRLLKLISIYNPVYTVLDANGIGDPIVEQCQKDIRDLKRHDVKCEYRGRILTVPRNRKIRTVLYSNKKHRVGFVTDKRSKLDIIDGLVNVFTQKMIRIPSEFEPGMKILWEELLNYGYSYSSSKNIIYGTQHGHDDTVMALAMLVESMKVRPWIGFRSKMSGGDSFVL